jgi:hypothetical protein
VSLVVFASGTSIRRHREGTILPWLSEGWAEAEKVGGRVKTI